MIREVGADPDVVAAMMIAAIDQHVADAGGAHLAEGDFLRVVGGHGRIIKNPALPRSFAEWPRAGRNDPGRLRVGVAVAYLPASPGGRPGPTETVPTPKAGALPFDFMASNRPNRKAPPLLTGLCLAVAQHRLLAGSAHIHVDFHSDRHFDDFRCFPCHLALPCSRRALAMKGGRSPVKSFCQEPDLRFYQRLSASK